MDSKNTRENLLKLLQVIDVKLNSKVVLVSLGGTALTLMGIKEVSYDIDFIVVSAENQKEFYDLYYKTVDELKLTQGQYPLFTEFDLGLLQVKDYLQNSSLFNEIPLKHITLYAMGLFDIILTKNYRDLERDRNDITDIMKATPVYRSKIKARFLILLRQQDLDVRDSFAKSYERLEKNFGHLLK
ncbi:MAG: hypothetical protein Q8R00_02520 [Candidatus Nanoarchaeia archaeon]|nr:hypothetical protein [Candidatus Nanoarchaeia archaeon]